MRSPKSSPLTLERRTQKPDSSLWRVTRSTEPESRSKGVPGFSGSFMGFEGSNNSLLNSLMQRGQGAKTQGKIKILGLKSESTIENQKR